MADGITVLASDVSWNHPHEDTEPLDDEQLRCGDWENAVLIGLVDFLTDPSNFTASSFTKYTRRRR